MSKKVGPDGMGDHDGRHLCLKCGRRVLPGELRVQAPDGHGVCLWCATDGVRDWWTAERRGHGR